MSEGGRRCRLTILMLKERCDLFLVSGRCHYRHRVMVRYCENPVLLFGREAASLQENGRVGAMGLTLQRKVSGKVGKKWTKEVGNRHMEPCKHMLAPVCPKENGTSIHVSSQSSMLCTLNSCLCSSYKIM